MAKEWPSKPSPKWFKPGTLRRKLWDAQQGKCHLCGGDMIMRVGNHPQSTTFDHVIPRSQGGGGGANLKLAHNLCNTRRSSMSVEAYKLLYCTKAT